MAQMQANFNTAIEKISEVVKPRGDDPVLAEIKKQNEDLKLRLDAEREERHRSELARRDEELAKVKETVNQLANKPPGTKSELDVIDSTANQVLTRLDHGFDQIIGLVRDIPPPMASREKQAAKEAIAKGATITPQSAYPSNPRLQELANKNFGGK
jgi:hypothetical protein